ncbi:MAG: uL15 family ribosomal protein [Verrucomicrobiia bacterium]
MRLHNLKPVRIRDIVVNDWVAGKVPVTVKLAVSGHKGQKARSGGSIRLVLKGVRCLWIRRVPKRGFNHNAFKNFCVW